MAHILAIDDDEAMLILIKNALRKDGHEVTGVTQVTEKLKNKLFPYDLILLDVMMPDVPGNPQSHGLPYSFSHRERS